MAEDQTAGGMTSRAIPKVPEDPKELARFLKKILTNHYRDIATLFAMTTDCDAFEKKQRDNASS